MPPKDRNERVGIIEETLAYIQGQLDEQCLLNDLRAATHQRFLAILFSLLDSMEAKVNIMWARIFPSNLKVVGSDVAATTRDGGSDLDWGSRKPNPESLKCLSFTGGYAPADYSSYSQNFLLNPVEPTPTLARPIAPAYTSTPPKPNLRQPQLPPLVSFNTSPQPLVSFFPPYDSLGAYQPSTIQQSYYPLHDHHQTAPNYAQNLFVKMPKKQTQVRHFLSLMNFRSLKTIVGFLKLVLVFPVQFDELLQWDPGILRQSMDRGVLQFDRRDYYTAHGESSTFITKTYYHTTTTWQQIGSGSDGPSIVSVCKNMFDTLARNLLLDRTDRTLEIYEASGFNWRLVKSGTPGNIGSFEDVLFANNDMRNAPVVEVLFLSFRENWCAIGLGYVDLPKRVLGLAEFLDDSHLTNVESLHVALGWEECLLPMGSGKSNEYRTFHNVFTRCGVMLTESKKIEFKTSEAVQDLGGLCKDLLADGSNYGNYIVHRYNLPTFMRLDYASMRALNVLVSKSNANEDFNLLGLRKRTCTAGMGKRLLHMWLTQLLMDVNKINSRLDLVQAFVEDTELRRDLRQRLRKISDNERLVLILEKRRVGLHHIVKLYQSSLRLPYIMSALEKPEGQFSSLIREKYFDTFKEFADDDLSNGFIALVETSCRIRLIETQLGDRNSRNSSESVL